MPQLTETVAERLSSEQATALVQVLELKGQWENHRDDPSKNAASLVDLQARRKAFNKFQRVLAEYAAKYNNTDLPEPTQNVPERLVSWCEVLRVVFRRAEGERPAELMKKVYRLADRTATKMGKEPLMRKTSQDLGGVIAELDAVIAWCGVLATTPMPQGQFLKNRRGEAA